MEIRDYIPQAYPNGIENELDPEVKMNLMGQHTLNEIAKCNNFWKVMIRVAEARTRLADLLVGAAIALVGAGIYVWGLLHG